MNPAENPLPLVLVVSSVLGAAGGALVGVGIAWGKMREKLTAHDVRFEATDRWIERVETRVVDLERRK